MRRQSIRFATSKPVFEHVLKNVLGLDDDDLLVKALDGEGLRTIADVITWTDEHVFAFLLPRSCTDQFVMLYERHIADGSYEYVLQSAEEKIMNNQYDRCFVTSTGFDINPTDLTIT